MRTTVAVMPHNQRDLAFHERVQPGLVELVVVKIVMLAVAVTVTNPVSVFFFVRLVSLTATVVTVQRLHLGHYTFRQYLIWIVQI